MPIGQTVVLTILLLIVSNVFMTFAWYGHLRNLSASPVWIAILVSWGIAFWVCAAGACKSNRISAPRSGAA